MRQDSICIPRVITLLQNCIAKILGFLPHVYTEMCNGTLRMRMMTVSFLFSFFLLVLNFKRSRNHLSLCDERERVKR